MMHSDPALPVIWAATLEAMAELDHMVQASCPDRPLNPERLSRLLEHILAISATEDEMPKLAGLSAILGAGAPAGYDARPLAA